VDGVKATFVDDLAQFQKKQNHHKNQPYTYQSLKSISHIRQKKHGGKDQVYPEKSKLVVFTKAPLNSAVDAPVL